MVYLTEPFGDSGRESRALMCSQLLVGTRELVFKEHLKELLNPMHSLRTSQSLKTRPYFQQRSLSCCIIRS